MNIRALVNEEFPTIVWKSKLSISDALQAAKVGEVRKGVGEVGKRLGKGEKGLVWEFKKLGIPESWGTVGNLLEIVGKVGNCWKIRGPFSGIEVWISLRMICYVIHNIPKAGWSRYLGFRARES